MYMSIPIYKFCVYMQKQLQNMRFPTSYILTLSVIPHPPAKKKNLYKERVLISCLLLLCKFAPFQKSFAAFLSNGKQ